MYFCDKSWEFAWRRIQNFPEHYNLQFWNLQWTIKKTFTLRPCESVTWQMNKSEKYERKQKWSARQTRNLKRCVMTNDDIDLSSNWNNDKMTKMKVKQKWISKFKIFASVYLY